MMGMSISHTFSTFFWACVTECLKLNSSFDQLAAMHQGRAPILSEAHPVLGNQLSSELPW